MEQPIEQVLMGWDRVQIPVTNNPPSDTEVEQEAAAEEATDFKFRDEDVEVEQDNLAAEENDAYFSDEMLERYLFGEPFTCNCDWDATEYCGLCEERFESWYAMETNWMAEEDTDDRLARS